MRALLLSTLIVIFGAGPSDLWAGQKTVPTDVEAKALKSMASAIPLGARVKAQTNRGKRVNGTLMSITDDAVIIKKRTRLPEPAVTVAFSDLAQLELEKNEGMSPGKVIGIGLAAGAGAILTLFAFFAALGD
jgi:hypothetical protein